MAGSGCVLAFGFQVGLFVPTCPQADVIWVCSHVHTVKFVVQQPRAMFATIRHAAHNVEVSGHRDSESRMLCYAVAHEDGERSDILHKGIEGASASSRAEGQVAVGVVSEDRRLSRAVDRCAIHSQELVEIHELCDVLHLGLHVGSYRW